MKLIEQIKLGITRVAVIRKDVDERTKRETITRIHEGVIVQNRGAFVRVFSDRPRDKGGDVSPESSELFPVSSACCWLEQLSDRTTPFLVPASL